MFESQTDRIERDLTLHPPEHPIVGRVMDELRAALKGASHTVDRLVPDSREKSQALSAIELAVFHSIAGVARDQAKVIAAFAPDAAALEVDG